MSNRSFKIFGLVCLIACFFCGCADTDDVWFARSVMTRLTQGVYSVRKEIDWPSLKMLERDIGTEYNQLTTDETRGAYERAFVKGFELSFKEQGGSLKFFGGWRFYKHMDPDTGIVLAGSKDKNIALLFFIKHANGKRKIVEIKALKIVDKNLFYNGTR